MSSKTSANQLTIGIVVLAVLACIIIMVIANPSGNQPPIGSTPSTTTTTQTETTTTQNTTNKDADSDSITINGITYIKAVGHVYPNNRLYWYDSGFEEQNLEPQFSGTIIGYSDDRKSIVVRYSDGGVGNINRDTFISCDSYWVAK